MISKSWSLALLLSIPFFAVRAASPGDSGQETKPAPEFMEFAIVAEASDEVDLDLERKKLVSWVQKNPDTEPRKFFEMADTDGGPRSGFRWLPTRMEAGLYPNAGSNMSMQWELVRVEKEKKFRFTGADIDSLKVQTDPITGPTLAFSFKEPRRKDFQAFTEANVNRSLAWIVKGQIQVKPKIVSALPGMAIMSGHFTREELESMVQEWKIMNEPAYIKVQHCLISFKGSLPKPTVTRNKEEAKKLAYEILEKARKGENFDELVKQYTDDSAPGIYGMSNIGKPPRNPQEYPRARMVPAFGDTGFPLKVGEYGIADFDPAKSPYGWHIVKRIE